jgi:hypothetical protein
MMDDRERPAMVPFPLPLCPARLDGLLLLMLLGLLLLANSSPCSTYRPRAATLSISPFCSFLSFSVFRDLDAPLTTTGPPSG